MQIFENPTRETWKELLARPVLDRTFLSRTVANIVADVRDNGDTALKHCAKFFDKVGLDEFAVSEEEFAAADQLVSEELKAAIGIAKANIEKFHAACISEQKPVVETMPGVECWQKAVAIQRVGLYVPAGSAPLFSTVLMLAAPAKLAGCEQIVLCSPPNERGEIHAAILYTARLCGVTQVFKIGGAQAVAAMAYGTESVPAVDKIFGPGNQFVTEAKQQVTGTVAIDMPAGPSEVAVLADETAFAEFVAADLLSQAEHGPDSQVILVTDSRAFADAAIEQVMLQLEDLPRRETATAALANSNIFIVDNISAGVELINEYAPEHLIIATREADSVAGTIRNAGSVFIGNYSCESAGDYASGTNHTLPTGGFARSFSGVSVESFQKKITFQKLSREGLVALGPTLEVMARAEELTAHERAVSVRLREIGGGRVFDLDALTRKNIRALAPYSTARHEFAGTADVWLDANENPFERAAGDGLNRYPDPQQRALRDRLAKRKRVGPDQVFVGNGSDEAIDLLFRVFCEPGRDRAMICPPTYGMYRVAAEINDVAVDEVLLTGDFRLDVDGIRRASAAETKLVFICSPNNPTGNAMERGKILNVLSEFGGIVVVDEAYADFAPETSMAGEIARFPNLVVLQTFSKAWGLAGARVGAAYADARIIELLDRVKPPYNVSRLSQAAALRALEDVAVVDEWRDTILGERRRLADVLSTFDCVEKVYPSDANFLLVKVRDARGAYEFLLEKGIVVRDRSSVALCAGCLRITVGSPGENDRLLAALTAYNATGTSI